MYIDPRGPRFAAALTALLLAAALATGSGVAVAVQAGLFAAGALLGPARSPYGWLFRRFVRPRLRPAAALEPAALPRFAQAVGLACATAGAAGYLTGVPLLGVLATAAALFAATLNAVFGLCLGCELHLLVSRALGRPAIRSVRPTGPPPASHLTPVPTSKGAPA